MDARTDGTPDAETVNAIRARLRGLSEDASLSVAEAFRPRSEAMDSLEDEILALLPAPLASLREEAERLLKRWESLDGLLFHRLRARLRASPEPGPVFREMLEAYFPARERPLPIAPAGYDALDAFLNGLLHPRALPAASRPLEPGMVAYQKTPARIALELFDRCGLAAGESFCDVGSGLGQIPLLAHLLTGAKAVGIEREPAYADYARACASDLGLSAVEFRSIDAREADYAPFNVIFFYTPFRGRMLEEVLERILSQGREGLRVFAFGPCAADLAGREWLSPREPGHLSGSGLLGFDFRRIPRKSA
jgi:SAM-dependent methyltransferase